MKKWIILIFLSFNLFFLESAKAKERELRSEHFIIRYHEDVDDSYVYKIKEICEDFYRKITQEFNFIREQPWLWENRAIIYVAKDKENYLNEFMCPAWSQGCVNYQKKIIYTYPNQKRFISILAHELTHIIFREYIGRNIPCWLDEGVAVYMENKYGKENYKINFNYFKKVIKENKYIPFSKLTRETTFSLKTKPSDYVNLFYLQSFSIIYFLMKRYGRDNFSRFLFFLRNGDVLEKGLRKAYYDFSSLEKFEESWKKFFKDGWY
jgi:hypothetical protein